MNNKNTMRISLLAIRIDEYNIEIRKNRIIIATKHKILVHILLCRWLRGLHQYSKTWSDQVKRKVHEGTKEEGWGDQKG